jgi:hypothetical protein
LLDRMFSSLSEVEQAICAPNCHIPWTPHNIQRAIKGATTLGGQGRVRTIKGVSDHLPIGNNFPNLIRARCSKAKSKSIPRWVAKLPRFREIFLSRWEEEGKPDDPFTQDLLFEKIAHEASRRTLEDLKDAKSDLVDSLGRFNVGLTLMAEAQKLQPNHHRIEQLITKYPEIDLLDEAELGYNSDRLRDFLNALLAEDGVIEESLTDITTTQKLPISSQLKLCLPSSRKRLNGLRAEIGGKITHEPKEMDKMAGEHYGKIWSLRRSKGYFHATAYLGSYHPPPIPPDKQAAKPELEGIEKIIMDTNNSCVGPNGIPFQVYRVLCDIYAPIAKSILDKIGKREENNGIRVLPGKDFNLGILFLIPKVGNGTIDDTRPISVTNASNRIIAKCISAAMLPVLHLVLHPCQKGYLYKRDGGDHIRTANERFYRAVQSSGKLQYYIMFMDYHKAFDSIDHDFIMAALKKLGLPEWIQNAVWALLHNVQVKTACGGAEATWIAIKRGVKQGCPLSPLLFAICYDPLLSALDRMAQLDPFAFADDLALGTTTVASLNPAMKAIDVFGAASGLTKNIKKTKLLCANNRIHAEAELKLTVWKDLLTTDSYQYLGVLFGEAVTLEDIYRPKVDEIWQLTLDSLPGLRKLKREMRMIGFNIFVYARLVYLLGFFPFPDSTATGSAMQTLDKARRVYTTRFFGSAYPSPLLLTAPDFFGIKPAAKDPWVYGLANLTNPTKLLEWNGIGKPEAKVMPGIPYSMCTSDLAQGCAEEVASLAIIGDSDPLVKFNGQELLVMEDKEGEPTISRKKTRAKIYTMALERTYRPSCEKKLTVCIRRREIPGLTSGKDILIAIQHLHGHQRFNKTISNYIKNINVDLICNSMVTDRRYKVTIAALNKLPRQVRIDKTHDCYLCGGRMDSAEHLYSDDCTVTREARAKYILATGVETRIPGISIYQSSLLLFEPTTKTVTQAITIYNAAIWIERCTFYSLLPEPLTTEASVNHLVHAANMIWRSYITGNKTSRKQRVKGKKRDIELEKATNLDSADLIKRIDWANTITCFANGAVVGTGSGAGVHIEMADKVGFCDLMIGLEAGNAIIGGLFAIGAAIECILNNLELGDMSIESKKKVIILTNCKEGANHCNINQPLNDEMANYRIINLIKRKMNLIRDKELGIYIYWTPTSNPDNRSMIATNLATQGCYISSGNELYKNFNTINIEDTLREDKFNYPP